MLLASGIAGKAIHFTGCGICHCIAHALGSIINVPHGIAIAYGLLHTIEPTLKYNQDLLSRYNGFFENLKLDSLTQEIQNWLNNFKINFDIIENKINFEEFMKIYYLEDNKCMRDNTFYQPTESELKNLHILFATAQGKIRKNNLEDFSSINASGKIAMKLDSNDKIIGVKICNDDEDIILNTKFGKCIRFEAKKLRVFKGRSSKGIKGINLSEKDSIVSLSIIDHDVSKKKNGKITKDEKLELKAKEKFILSITENGFGKRTSHYDFRVTGRGGKGIIGIVNSARNGNVSSSFPVNEGDEIVISTNKGRVIRCAVKEIRVAGRNTQGVRIIKLPGEEIVVSAIKIDDNLLQ